MMYQYSLILAIILISIGIVGALSRKNVFILYMSIELILNGINLGFITASSIFGKEDGLVIAVMIMAIAAAEAALFLAMIVLLFRSTHTLDTSEYTLLKSKESTNA